MKPAWSDARIQLDPAPSACAGERPKTACSCTDARGFNGEPRTVIPWIGIEQFPRLTRRYSESLFGRTTGTPATKREQRASFAPYVPHADQRPVRGSNPAPAGFFTSEGALGSKARWGSAPEDYTRRIQHLRRKLQSLNR